MDAKLKLTTTASNATHHSKSQKADVLSKTVRNTMTLDVNHVTVATISLELLFVKKLNKAVLDIKRAFVLIAIHLIH